MLDINELEEIRNDAYINSSITNKTDGITTSRKELHVGKKVLLYDSRFHLFRRKLKSRWKGSYIIHSVLPNRACDIINPEGGRTFKVNKHRLKHYFERFDQFSEVVDLLEPT